MLTKLRKIRSAARPFINYCAVASCIYAFAYLPLRMATKLAVFLSFFWRRLDSENFRRAVRHSMDRLNLDPEAAAQFAAANFKHYLIGMMEFSKLLRLSPQDVLSCVDEAGFDTVMEQTLENPSGALIVSCHMGNWVWFATYLGLRGYIAGHVINPFENKRIDALVTRIRTRHGCVLWHKRGVIAKAAKALRRGRAYSLMLDLDLGKSGWMSPFLGKPASTNAIPIELAAKMKSPIIVAALVRRPGHPLKFKMIYSSPLVPKDDTKQEVQRLIDEINNRFSAMILDYPDQWWWRYRRWRTQNAVGYAKTRLRQRL